MHCIGELMEPMARGGLEVLLQDAVAGLGDGGHHAVGADGDDAIGARERDRLLAEGAGGVGLHALDEVADEGAVLRAAGGEAGGLVAAPDDDVGGGLDVLDAVAVGEVPIAGEVGHLRAGGAQRAARWRRKSVPKQSFALAVNPGPWFER
jgi:hypothetical protein